MAIRRKEKGSVSKLDQARALYKAGFDLHWIRPAEGGNSSSGKAPIGSSWNRDARQPWEQLEQTYKPLYNLGFQPGKTSVVAGQQLAVIDFDFEDPALEGEGREELAELIGTREPTVRTGSGRGEHYYFLFPLDMEIPTGKILWGAGHNEIRLISYTGNAVMPPSVHHSGNVYVWVDREYVTAPQSLIDAVMALTTKSAMELDFGEIGKPVDLRKIGYKSRLARTILHGVPKGERSEACNWVIAELRERNLNVSVILATMLNPDWGISAKYRESGRRAIERAKDDITRVITKVENKKKKRESEMTERFAWFSEKYCYVIYGDTDRIFYQDTAESGGPRPMKIEAFTRLYSTFDTLGDKGKTVSPVREWLVSPERPTYHQIVFDPGRPAWRDGEKDVLNWWQGLAVKGDRSAGTCELFKKHLLENVCAGKTELYDWFWNYIAQMIVHPEIKPGTSIILKGETGTGKSMVTDTLTHLIGSAHSTVVYRREQVAGKFNKILADKILVVGEEIAWGGEREMNHLLRHLITGGGFQIEPKGVDAFEVASFHRLIMCTNEEWIVNALAKERRYALLEVGVKRQNDRRFFEKMLAELKAGGYQRLMWELQQTSVDMDLVRTIPQTDLLADQQSRSLPAIAQWIEMCLRRGYFLGDGWRIRVSPELMVAACRNEYPRERWINRDSVDRTLAHYLYYGQGVTRLPMVKISGSTKRGWSLPKSLDGGRASFLAASGSLHNFEERRHD